MQSKHQERRMALDGHTYTYQEFKAYYEPKEPHWQWRWEQAGLVTLSNDAKLNPTTPKGSCESSTCGWKLGQKVACNSLLDVNRMEHGYCDSGAVLPQHSMQHSYFSQGSSSHTSLVRAQFLPSNWKDLMRRRNFAQRLVQTTLLDAIKPCSTTIELRQRVFKTLEAALESLPVQLFLAGSVAKGTDLKSSKTDVDVVLLWEDFDPKRYHTYLKQVESRLRPLASRVGAIFELDDVASERIRTQISTHHVTGRMQFEDICFRQTQRRRGFDDCDYFGSGYVGYCPSCKFDVLVGGVVPEKVLLDRLIHASASERSSLGPSLASAQVNFISSQPREVRDTIRMAKWWKHTIIGRAMNKLEVRSYLLELLVVHSAACLGGGGANSNGEKPKMSVFGCAGDLDDPPCFAAGADMTIFISTLEAISNWKRLRVLWSWGSLLDSGILNFHEQSEVWPIVLDPANPTNNVARCVKSWPEFGDVAASTLELIHRAEIGTTLCGASDIDNFSEDDDDDDAISAGFNLRPRIWHGNEHRVTIDNCELYGMNDYIFEKYGGMMGMDSWFGDNIHEEVWNDIRLRPMCRFLNQVMWKRH